MPNPVSSATERKQEFELFNLKSDVYLKMITIAICETNDNRGTLRKTIWNYLQTVFNKSVDYRDFLLAVAYLEKRGKLFNKNGFFFVQD